MNRSLHSWLRAAEFVVVFVFGILAAQVPGCMDSFAGPRYDPKNPADLARLRRFAYEATPLLEAIKEFQAAHGTTPTPAQLADLPRLTAAYKATCLNGIPGWTYLPAGGDFGLDLKLGWDPSLQYDSATHVWKYDPGDGTGPTTIEL